MATITLTLPPEVIRDARVEAAHRGTSVSGLVQDALQGAIGIRSDYDEIWRRELALMRAGTITLDPKGPPTRDELHER